MKSTKLLPSLAILALLTACSKKDSTAHYADALAFLANQQYSSAVIELRSAIQQDPDNFQFRLALGKALLKNGDIINAERELDRALRYGAPHDDVAVYLAQAHYLAGNHSALVSLLNDSTALEDRSQDLLNSYKALAESELGDIPAAILLFEQLSASAEADIAAFATAHLKLVSQESELALAALLSINVSSELYAEGLFLQSKIHLSANDNVAAINTLERYIELTPTMHLARLLLAQAYVGNSQFEQSEKHLSLLLKLFPDQPVANYLLGIVSFQKEDFTAAKLFSEKAINQPSLARQARMIAALSSVRLGLDAQALSHLDSIKDQLQQNPDIHRLYAVLQLRAGETELASTILAQLPEQEQDLQLIATTAFELLRQGSVSSAQQLLSNYEQHNTQMDAATLATLGTIKLGIAGQQDVGISNLEQALNMEPGLDQTRLILAINYLQRQEFEKSEKLADAWIKDEKMQIAGYNLKAFGYYLQEDFDTAKQLTDKALIVHPFNPFSSLIQALIDTKNGKLTQAQQLLQQSLDRNPTYLAGYEQLYTVSRALGNTEDATKRITALHQQYPDVYAGRLLLARVHQDQQQFSQSLALLNNTNIADSEKSDLHWLIVIEANLQLNNNNNAITQARAWFQQDPDNSTAGFTYANALTINKQPNEALQVVNQLLAKYPGQPRLLMGQISLLAQLQRNEQALAVINNLPVHIAAQQEIQFLKGRLALIEGDFTTSLKAFQQSYSINPTAETAMLIGNNLATQQSEQQALHFIQQHIKQHGTSSELQTYLATLLIKSDSQQAGTIYKALIAEQPNNVVALNNYAWLLLQDKQAVDAKQYAERAIKLLPNNPDIIDTYGQVLLMLKQPTNALLHFEHSLRIRPNHPDVSLNYAQALIETQQHNKAREILSALQSAEPAIMQRQSELLQQLP